MEVKNSFTSSMNEIGQGEMSSSSFSLILGALTRSDAEVQHLTAKAMAKKVEVCADEHATGGHGVVQRHQKNEACFMADFALGSKWCLFPCDSDIALSDVGTVVGFSADGQVEVEFHQATKLFSEDDLIPFEIWRQKHVDEKEQGSTRDLLEIAEAVRVMNPQLAATATEELYAAARGGNRKLVKECIATGAYPNKYKNSYGRTSLHESAIHGDAAVVQLLVAAGASTSAKDKDGATPLDLATDETCRGILEHHNTVLTTLKSDPAALVTAAASHCTILSAPEEMVLATSLSLRPYQLDPWFLWAPPAARTVLFTWARDVYLAQLAIITDPFEALPDDCAGDVLDYFGMAMNRVEALHVAAQWSSPEVRAWVRAVIVAAVSVKATANLGPAAKVGNLAAVDDCLEKGADVDVRAAYGFTALIYASSNGHTTVVKRLLKAGADKDAKYEDGHTLLFRASSKGHTEIVELLLKAGADKEAKNKNRFFGDGLTALVRAASNGHAAVVDLLIKAGADKDAKDFSGYTALMFASTKGHSAVVELLLEAGADKDAKNRDGMTALIFASSKGYATIVDLLLNAGADKEAKNKVGLTALMQASCKGHTAIVALLLQAGANKDVENNGG